MRERQTDREAIGEEGRDRHKNGQAREIGGGGGGGGGARERERERETDKTDRRTCMDSLRQGGRLRDRHAKKDTETDMQIEERQIRKEEEG